METQFPPPQKTNAAQPVSLKELQEKGIEFKEGKLTVNGKNYIVEYFPKGINNGEKAELTTEQMTEIGNLALKILQASLGEEKINLNGVTINQKEITLPTTENESKTKDKSEGEKESRSIEVNQKNTNKIFQEIYEIIKPSHKKESPHIPKKTENESELLENKGIEIRKKTPESPKVELPKSSKDEPKVEKKSPPQQRNSSELQGKKEIDEKQRRMFFYDEENFSLAPKSMEEEEDMLRIAMLQSLETVKPLGQVVEIGGQKYKTAGVPGDGNCMFHAIAMFSKKNKSQQEVRNELADYIEKDLPQQKKNFTTLIGSLIGLTIPKDEIKSKSDDFDEDDVKRACSTYAKELRVNATEREKSEVWLGELNTGVQRSSNSYKGWGGEEEYQIAAHVYNKPIYVWNRGSLERYSTKDKDDVVTVEQQFEKEKDKAIVLYYNGINHYDALFPIDGNSMQSEDIQQKGSISSKTPNLIEGTESQYSGGIEWKSTCTCNSIVAAQAFLYISSFDHISSQLMDSILEGGKELYKKSKDPKDDHIALTQIDLKELNIQKSEEKQAYLEKNIKLSYEKGDYHYDIENIDDVIKSIEENEKEFPFAITFTRQGATSLIVVRSNDEFWFYDSHGKEGQGEVKAYVEKIKGRDKLLTLLTDMAQKVEDKGDFEMKEFNKASLYVFKRK